MKRITITLSLIALLIVAVYVFARFALKTHGFRPPQAADSAYQTKPAETALDLRPRIIARLQQLVNKGSNGLFNLHIADVEPDILASAITLKNVLLEPDSSTFAAMDHNEKSSCNIFRFKSDSIHITGIGISDIFSKEAIDLKKVFINNPIITIEQKYAGKRNDSVSLYRCLFGQLKRFSAKNIVVRNGTVVNHIGKGRKTVSFRNFYAELSDLLIDSTSQNDKSRFLFAKKATLTLKNYNRESKDGFYSYSIDNLSVTTSDQTIRAENFALHPNFSNDAFAKKAGIAKERYEMRVSSLLLKNVDWWNLANNESLVADEAIVNSGNLDIYLDRSMPAEILRVGNYPHQLLMKMPMKLYIRKVDVKNMHFDYAEYNPQSAKKGGFSINNIHGTISNLTNMPSAIKSQPLTKIQAAGTFMGLSEASLSLQLNMLEYKNGTFQAALDIKGFDGTLINPLAEPIGLFSIKKGTLKELKSFVHGNNNRASGTVVFQYEDLKVAALEKDSNKPGGLDKKDVTSFIANTFVVKKQNPVRGGDPRKEEASANRDIYSSFFNLIWKTTFVGILKTTGLPERLAYKK